MPSTDSEILTDGSTEFSGGVDSLKPTTVAGKENPGGLARNQLAWLVNGTVRDGGISPRAGWKQLLKVADGTSFYQGGFMYQPLNDNPYLILSIGGQILKVVPDFPAPVNLSLTNPGQLSNPPNIERAFFCQGEDFLVIQAGDGATLPLFWDGTTLRRSKGLNPVAAPGTIIGQSSTTSNVLPAQGGSTMIPFTSVGSLNIGDAVVLLAHGSSYSEGSYTVTAKNGNTLTLQRTDQNAGTNGLPFFGTLDLVLASNGFSTGVPELPAGYQMDYYMQRIWYVFGDRKTYTAGDLAGNTSSGTIKYNFRDSVLKVTENPLAIGGDGFHLPSNSGEITALTHQTSLDASLGQGRLYVSTRKQIYALSVPVTRANWIDSNSTNQPLQTIIQIANGAVGDRSVVTVNGDIYYQSLTPDVRSLITAVRYFGEPGNTGISNQEERILQFTDRSIQKFSTAMEFDNRCLQSALPKRLPQGIVHQALMPLDFTPISEFGSTLAPVWEGHWEGLDILQVFTGDFGGLERSFAVVVSRADSTIWLWELTQGELFENGDNRITWQIEFPAFTFGREFDLKRLVGGEVWFDRLFGTAEVYVEYRTDGNNCWTKWIAFKECSARNCAETIPDSCQNVHYPPAQQFGYGYRNTKTFPKPPVDCDIQMERPSDIGHQFQVRLTIHGSLRIRGLFVHATKVERKLYSNGVCAK